MILYYFFCWKWSKKSRKYVICSHPKHNARNFELANHSSVNTAFSLSLNDQEMNLYNMSQMNSKSSMNCFLINATRLRTFRRHDSSTFTGSRRSIRSEEENFKMKRINRRQSSNSICKIQGNRKKNRLRHVETIA